jgi:hypothetical protein
MKIFTKAGNLPPTKLQKRVEKIGTTDLILWVETSLYSIGKNITHWSRESNSDMLEDAHMGAEALLAITTELKRRERNG